MKESKPPLAILEALLPVTRASFGALSAATELAEDAVRGHVSNLRDAGLAKLSGRPVPSGASPTVSLTAAGRSLVASHREYRRMGEGS